MRKSGSSVKQRQLRRKKRKVMLKRRMKSLTMKKYGNAFSVIVTVCEVTCFSLHCQFLEGEDDLEGSEAEGGEEEPKEAEEKAKDEL